MAGRSRPATGQGTATRGARGAHRRPRRTGPAKPAPKARRAPKAKGGSKDPRRPATRAERRRAAKVRRTRVFLAVSVVLSALVLAAWFPASALVHQHQALAGASGQLHQLQSQNRDLSTEERRLNQSSEIERLARQQYQLVSPGQQAYQVLPASGTGGPAGSYPGDPGLQRPVAPSAASELPPTAAGGSDGSSPAASSGHHETTGAGPARPSGATKGASPGIVGRILQTLEFWR